MNKTIIFVTHDIDEAIKLGDRIIVMNNGKIEQDGNVKDISFLSRERFYKRVLWSQNFTSYLSQIKIKDVLSDCKCDEKEFISEDISVMEGLQELFNCNRLEICVKNSEGLTTGSFRFDKIKDKILSNDKE